MNVFSESYFIANVACVLCSCHSSCR